MLLTTVYMDLKSMYNNYIVKVQSLMMFYAGSYSRSPIVYQLFNFILQSYTDAFLNSTIPYHIGIKGFWPATALFNAKKN